MTRRKILITGGTGFIGSHLTKGLVDDGHDVRVLARPSGAIDTLKGLPVEIIEGDIRDRDAVDRAVKGVEVVIHLVSNFRHPEWPDQECEAVNVGGSKNIFESALRHSVRRFIHCSTIGVHGHIENPPANEDSPFNPGDIYQRTKLEAEKLAWSMYHEKGLPLTVVRPTSVYGPGDLRMLKMFRMIKKKRFFILGKGDALFHPIYISDLVEGFRLCLGSSDALGKVFIIGGDEIVTLKKMAATAAEEMGVPPATIHLPILPFYVLGYLCEKICIPLGIPPPIFRRRVKFFVNHRAFDITRARTVLGFKSQVDLRTGMRRAIEWYEKNGYLS
jgi:nucleoside-diphosphate-sugar epimerase